MKALITGCAGFIGSNLTQYLLDKGLEIYGIDCFTDYYPREIKEKNLEYSLKCDKFHFLEEDIMVMDSFPEADYIFHMAAQAGVRSSWGEKFHIYTRNNIEATQKLLEFYKDKTIKKFVYSSSSSVYGDAELPMNENSILKPVSPYGVSKLAGEHLCYLYWKNFGVPTISLRYFTVYGPRQRPDMGIHKFVKAVIEGTVIDIYGDGEQSRDFTFVFDVINALDLSAKSSYEGEVFNIGGGSRITVNELIKEIEKITGKVAQLNYMEKQKGDVRDTGADLSKTSSKLGWEPEFTIEDGLNEFVRWYHGL